jgi:hypothetical protein
VERIRQHMRMADWQAVVPLVLDDLAVREVAGVARVLRPLLEARFGDYLTMPASEIVEAAQGFGFTRTDVQAQTLRAVVEAVQGVSAATTEAGPRVPVRSTRRRPVGTTPETPTTPA